MNWQENMNSAVKYVEEHLFEEIDFTKLQKIVGQSSDRFARTFSTVAGMTLTEYIRARRMAVAAKQVVETDNLVIDIALNCGYSSPEAFSRAFSKAYGMPPATARKEKPKLDLLEPLSFNLTVSEDVQGSLPDCDELEPEELKAFNTPDMRLIGKRYTSKDLDADSTLMSKWNDCFQSGIFNILAMLGPLQEIGNAIIFAMHMGEEVSFWMGMLFPAGTNVPTGMDFADFNKGSMGACYILGDKNKRSLFSPMAQKLGIDMLKSYGYETVYQDFSVNEGCWRFELYEEEKYNSFDETGRVSLGHCFFLKNKKGNELSGKTIKLKAAPKSSLKAVPADVELLECEPFVTENSPQDDLLFCALAVLAIKAGGINENTQFYCGMANKVCNRCGGCKMSEKDMKYAFRAYTYQFLLGCSGNVFLWPENIPYGKNEQMNKAASLLPDGLSFALRAAGISYKLFDTTSKQGELKAEISASLKKDLPVLVEFAEENDWAAVLGMSKNSLKVYGIDSYNHPEKTAASAERTRYENGIFSTDSFFTDLKKCIVPTGKSEPVELAEILERCKMCMSLAKEQGAEEYILNALKNITSDNARSIATVLNDTIGYTAQSRWHAACMFRKVLPLKTNDLKLRKKLCEIGSTFVEMHDICWKIWGQLGVGPFTNYTLPNTIVSMMSDKKRQEELLLFFSELFALQNLAKEKIEALVNV